jgi:hypothetical protein
MARKKTKMRTGKVKRVKKTRNSRRTKRNTRRRNKRGGDGRGSLELIKALGKSVGSSLKKKIKEKLEKYSRKHNKGNREPLLEEQKIAAEAKATRQEMLNIARTNGIEQDNLFFDQLSEHLATEEGEKIYDYGPGGRIKLVKEVRTIDNIKKEKREMLEKLFPRNKYPKLY